MILQMIALTLEGKIMSVLTFNREYIQPPTPGLNVSEGWEELNLLFSLLSGYYTTVCLDVNTWFC